MEKIVDVLEMQKPLPESYASKLKLLSMRENEYPMIPDRAIEAFLRRHLKRSFDKDMHGTVKVEFGLKQEHGGLRHKVSSPIVHWTKEKKRRFFKTVTTKIPDRGWTGYHWWDEMPLSAYPGNPPEHVLTAALRAKEGGYENLSVVTVNCEVVEDPLLIGFKDGKRYLLDWWDKDFTAEQIQQLCDGAAK